MPWFAYLPLATLQPLLFNTDDVTAVASFTTGVSCAIFGCAVDATCPLESVINDVDDVSGRL